MKPGALLFIMIVMMSAVISGCKKDNTGNEAVSYFKINGWEVDSIGFNYNWVSPKSADFLSLKTGYVLGSNGDLLKTTDSATSWGNFYIEKDSSGVMTSALSFINDTTGYVYGKWNVLNGNYFGILYKTTDGGAHWTKQFYDTAYNFCSMKFFDINHGIALNWVNAGSFILTTDNGGLTWDAVSLDLDHSQNKLFFVGDICYVTGNNEEIFKSVDHGKTWITLHTPTSSSAYISGFYLVNENTGFLCKGSDRYKTTDGGESWKKINTSFPGFRTPAASAENFHFCNNSDGLIINDSIAYTGGDFPSFIGSYTYITTDGGESWIKSVLQKQLSLGLVAFVSDNSAYCISYDHVYKLKKK
jgi:photosystem II stability/assembly factor-like uncharacterized protein